MKYGININGDLGAEVLKKCAATVEDAGFDFIWVGESESFIHPFSVMAAVLENTSEVTVGTGIISPRINRCEHIIRAFKTLAEVYGERLVIGIAGGDIDQLRTLGIGGGSYIETIDNCLQSINHNNSTIPKFVGASGPRMIGYASSSADGVLLNFVHPSFIRWALRFFERKDIIKVAYGPSLLYPNEKLKGYLRISAARVAVGYNKAFIGEFGFQRQVEEIGCILKKKEFARLGDHDDFLLANFAIVGEASDFKERIKELECLGIDQLVFSAPFSRDLSAIQSLGSVLYE